MNRNSIPADDLAKLANNLFDAEFERRSIEPLTDSCPDLALEDAYKIQQLNIERRLAGGEKVIGHKIGLTGKPMQEKFGVNEPDYGHLLDSMYQDESDPLDLGQLIDPQVEVEPGFVLGKDLAGPGLTINDVIGAFEGWTEVGGACSSSSSAVRAASRARPFCGGPKLHVVRGSFLRAVARRRSWRIG